jgi:magnesium transporter
MRTALYSAAGDRPVPVEGEDEIARIVRDGRGCLWVDLEAPGEDDRRLLSSAFRFHSFAIESCAAPTPHPRLHDYGGYVYLAFHAVRGLSPLALEEVDIFLGSNFLVTYHAGPIESIRSLWKEAREVEGTMKRGPDCLLGSLLDQMADGYLTAMETLDGMIDRLEDRLFNQPGGRAIRDVFRIKKEVLQLRRVVGPQREMLNRLARGEFPVITKEEAYVFRDVHDRVFRVADMLESFRDLLTSAMEVYLTAVSNRTNEVMKILTVFSIVLMSSSLVAGLYGMNVELPLVGRKADFLLVLGVMLALSGALLVFFRKRRWI